MKQSISEAADWPKIGAGHLEPVVQYRFVQRIADRRVRISQVRTAPVRPD
jgi:hypothetical protein